MGQKQLATGEIETTLTELVLNSKVWVCRKNLLVSPVLKRCFQSPTLIRRLKKEGIINKTFTFKRRSGSSSPNPMNGFNDGTHALSTAPTMKFSIGSFDEEPKSKPKA